MSQEYDSVQLVPEATVRHLSGAVMIAGLTAVLAQVSIPLPGGIPFSLQPFGVFVAGLVLGPVWGGFALLLYLLVGVAGAPVFSNGGAGLGYLLGPTGGFLVGFVLAGFLIGTLVHRSTEPRGLDDRSVVLTTASLLLALAPIYGIGVPWFARVQGWSLLRAMGFMTPFLAGDIIKVGLTVGMMAGGTRLLREYR